MANLSVKNAESKLNGTALMCAVVRAVETMRPVRERILDDQFAKHFMNRRYMALFSYRPLAFPLANIYDKLFAGWAAEIILRYRHCDERLRKEVADGCKQVVILGAGYDSTALRCQFDRDVTFYELDKPAIQQDKLAILSRKSLSSGNRVKYVGCDFNADEDLGERLIPQGFDPNQPCFVSWLGVSYYLSETAVRNTLAQLGRTCAPGSKVMLDYIAQSVVDQTIDHSGALRGARFAAKRGEPFSFGLGRAGIDDLVVGSGFRTLTDASMSELVDRYGVPEDFWLAVNDFAGVVTLERERMG